ncbi:MAG: acyltransferase [Bacteroidota bacterium]|nr:acyltransferase [Bacteroidota bacterium]
MRLEQLTFTRFIAVAAIVVFHFGTSVYPFNIPLLSPLFHAAYVGVSYMYLLSGFVMMIAYQHKKKEGIALRTFYRNRLARVYPMYVLALVITIFFYSIDERIFSVQEVLLNVFALQAWVPGDALSLNAPGWSVSVEVFFYVLFPLLFNYVYRNGSFIKLMLIAILLWLLTQVGLNIALHTSFYKGFPSASHDLLFYFPLMHLNEFIIGNIAGLLFVIRKEKQCRNNDGLLLLLVAISVVGVYLLQHFSFHDGLFALLYAPLLYCLSLNDGNITRLFTKKIFVWAGEISYAIFILQKPFFLFGRKYLPSIGVKDSAIQFYIIFILLLIFSFLTYRYVETPARKWILQWKP